MLQAELGVCVESAMPAREMTMVFAYDISRPRTRARVASLLEDHAVRVQGSVFEARLGRDAAERLFALLSDAVDPGDSLRMYAISSAGLARCRQIGGAEVTNDEGYWLL